MDLKELGISREELIDRIADKVVVAELGAEDEAGEVANALRGDIHRAVQERIDAAIHRVAEEHVLPNAETMIDNVVLQRTNEWGERKGEPMSFREYLTERAHSYLTEQVDHDGKAKGEKTGGMGWRSYGTRIEHMIDRHLTYQISSAMKDAVQQVDKSIADGLQKAVQVKLKELQDSLKVSLQRR